VAEVGGISGFANRVEDVARMGAPAGSGSLLSKQEQFSGLLARSKAAQTPEERARSAAEQLVATALVQPVLKQLRESNNAAPPFAPNQAERTFRGLFDAAIAQRMVHAQHWGLVDRLARGMLTKMGLPAAPTTGAT
jgi:Rod binding domain-containing protein